MPDRVTGVPKRHTHTRSYPHAYIQPQNHNLSPSSSPTATPSNLKSKSVPPPSPPEITASPREPYYTPSQQANRALNQLAQELDDHSPHYPTETINTGRHSRHRSLTGNSSALSPKPENIHAPLPRTRKSSIIPPHSPSLTSPPPQSLEELLLQAETRNESLQSENNDLKRKINNVEIENTRLAEQLSKHTATFSNWLKEGEGLQKKLDFLSTKLLEHKNDLDNSLQAKQEILTQVLHTSKGLSDLYKKMPSKGNFLQVTLAKAAQHSLDTSHSAAQKRYQQIRDIEKISEDLMNAEVEGSKFEKKELLWISNLLHESSHSKNEALNPKNDEELGNAPDESWRTKMLVLLGGIQELKTQISKETNIVPSRLAHVLNETNLMKVIEAGLLQFDEAIKTDKNPLGTIEHQAGKAYSYYLKCKKP